MTSLCGSRVLDSVTFTPQGKSKRSRSDTIYSSKIDDSCSDEDHKKTLIKQRSKSEYHRTEETNASETVRDGARRSILGRKSIIGRRGAKFRRSILGVGRKGSIIRRAINAFSRGFNLGPSNGLPSASSASTVSLVRRNSEDVSGENVLHMACRAHPPLEYVKRMVKECPSFPKELNSQGRTPLHVAAAKGASPQVIDYLLKEYPSAAAMRDSCGQTPLSLACEQCCQERWCDTGNSRGDVIKGPLLKVVNALCDAAPASVNSKDDDGSTALEYAICMGASVKVVRALHRSSKKGWEISRKEGWKGDKDGLESEISVTRDGLPYSATSSKSCDGAESTPKRGSAKEVKSSKTEISPAAAFAAAASISTIYSMESITESIEDANGPSPLKAMKLYRMRFSNRLSTAPGSVIRCSPSA